MNNEKTKNHINNSLWKRALHVSKTAIASKDLIPLETSTEFINCSYKEVYQLRHFHGETPKQTNELGPRINPFRPWNKNLEIKSINKNYVLILNKYPVQLGHMLLISKSWQPQIDWFSIKEWEAVTNVDKNTSGLWFYNSGKNAGASQPHRHIQLLPRHHSEQTCPREKLFCKLIQDNGNILYKNYNKTYTISKLHNKNFDSEELHNTYKKLCKNSGLGIYKENIYPKYDYNLLFTRNWMVMIVRKVDTVHGFDINALGFAGYILATSNSDLKWLSIYGIDKLLSEVTIAKNIK